MSAGALLGPQRLRPTLAGVARSLGIDGPLALVTAGWEEREAEDEELRTHLARPTVNLRLWERAEELLAAWPALADAKARRDEALAESRSLYRVRLGHALAAARELLARADGSAALSRERSGAIETVRRLDRRQLRLVEEILERHDEVPDRAATTALARHRRQIAESLAACEGVALAGGHVGVLLDRLRLFAVAEAIQGQPILAWSAGAMVLGEQVVLFHDRLPQGPGDAEVLGRGLGLSRGILPLPDARRRLRLDDRPRVALLARRFAPQLCVALDEGARLVWDGVSWRAPEPVPWLATDGGTTLRRGPGGGDR